MKTDFSPIRRRWSVVLISSVLPLLLLALYFSVKHVSGPYFYSANIDPDYPYFFNGLNINTGRAPFHIDHPGTPVQLLLAGIIGVCSPGEKTWSIIASSEQYLHLANCMLFAFILGSFALAGWLIYRKTQRAWPVILFQGSIAFLGANLYCLSRANPEPAMLGVALLLGVLVYLDISRASEKTAWSFVFIAALLCATGAACKLTFISLVLLPLLLIRGGSRKGVYLVLFFLFFTLWLWPDYGSADRFFQWIKSLASHTGRYGSGAVGLIEPHAYLANLLWLLAQNFTFAVLLAASIVVPLWQWRSTQRLAPAARALLFIAFSETLQIAMVCKYRENRYLLPALGLAGLNALLLEQMLQGSRWCRWCQFFWTILILAGAGQGGCELHRLHRSSLESAAILQEMETAHAVDVKIYGYAASSQAYALYFGNEFSGGLYDRELKQLNRDSDRTFFYDFGGFYHGASGPVPLQKILKLSGSKVFQSAPFLDGPRGVKLRERFGGDQEKIYEIVP